MTANRMIIFAALCAAAAPLAAQDAYFIQKIEGKKAAEAARQH